MDSQIKKTKKCGLEVFHVYLFGVFFAEFLSINGAVDCINRFELDHQEILNNEII